MRKFLFIIILLIGLATFLAPFALAASITGPTLQSFFGRGQSLYTLGGIVTDLLNWALSLAGIVAFIFLIVGGFKYLTAQGDQKAIAGAQQTIFGAVIGLLIVFVSYWVVKILETLLGVDIISGLIKPVYAQVDIKDSFILGGGGRRSVGALYPDPVGLGKLVQTLVPAIFTIAGLAFLIHLIIGAFRYVTSGGDEKALGDARKTITSALVGLLIVFASYWIIKILETITGIHITF